MPTATETKEEQRAQDCINGENHYVCFDCRDKYSSREPSDTAVTCRNGDCHICEEHTTVASSRKLFGHHRMIG